MFEGKTTLIQLILHIIEALKKINTLRFFEEE